CRDDGRDGTGVGAKASSDFEAVTGVFAGVDIGCQLSHFAPRRAEVVDSCHRLTPTRRAARPALGWTSPSCVPLRSTALPPCVSASPAHLDRRSTTRRVRPPLCSRAYRARG